MTTRRMLLIFGSILALGIVQSLPAAPTTRPARRDQPADDSLVEKQWKIDDVERKALVFIPPTATTQPAPLVFAFHGHGGNMKYSSNAFALHKHWPEAIVVYPQGLPTPALTDPDGKLPGWQKTVGDQQDRDLKFFDEMLKSMQADYKVDPKRIYAMGHSNGGAFTYLLWAARGDTFAAVAPAAAVLNIKHINDLKPKPAIHIAGETDPLVKFEMQKRMMDFVEKLNGCDTDGKPWASDGKLVGTIYPSKKDTPLVTLIAPGGHQYPSEASELIVKFFKEHPAN